MLQHLADLGEQRDRAVALIGDASEAGGRAQRRTARLRRRRGLRQREGAAEQQGASGGDTKDQRAHHTVPPTIGSESGRSRPSRASALATAGPIGGTPGSPTPVGFSVDGTILTSTAGISSIRSER
jgi:hypothetical protein